MIRVTVEVLPHGREADKYTLGEANIINDGTGTSTRGNYKYLLTHKGRKYRSGEIKRFPRLSKNVWVLLLRCLMDTFEEHF